jgi:hypothetical protein
LDDTLSVGRHIVADWTQHPVRELYRAVYRRGSCWTPNGRLTVWPFAVRCDLPANGTYVTASARPWLVDPVRDLAVIVLTQRLFETASATQVHRHLQAAAYQPLG